MTGVQTCALPILEVPESVKNLLHSAPLTTMTYWILGLWTLLCLINLRWIPKEMDRLRILIEQVSRPTKDLDLLQQLTQPPTLSRLQAYLKPIASLHPQIRLQLLLADALRTALSLIQPSPPTTPGSNLTRQISVHASQDHYPFSPETPQTLSREPISFHRRASIHLEVPSTRNATSYLCIKQILIMSLEFYQCLFTLFTFALITPLLLVMVMY